MRTYSFDFQSERRGNLAGLYVLFSFFLMLRQEFCKNEERRVVVVEELDYELFGPTEILSGYPCFVVG
jgi:hypothetical protein